VQGRVAQLERGRRTSGLVVVRDFLDKGEYYFSMTQLQETGFHPASSISLLSPLPLNRFMSNLISTESPYQGESNGVDYEVWG